MATTARVTRRGTTSEPAIRPSVAEEMRAIFAPLPQPAGPAEAPGATPPVGARNRYRPWHVGLTFLALMTLVAALLAFLPTPRQAPLRPEAATRLPSAPQAAAPRPAAATTPISAPSAPAADTARPAGRNADMSPPPRLAQPAARRATKSSRKASAHRCARGASQAWCFRTSVMAADDRLRGAYAAAIRAGVERSVLIGVRSDWKRLRARANADPQALIRGYALLTQELRAEARRADLR